MKIIPRKKKRMKENEAAEKENRKWREDIERQKHDQTRHIRVDELTMSMR